MGNRLLWACVLAVSIAGAANALGEGTGNAAGPAASPGVPGGPPAAAATPPSYSVLRWDENYAYLKDPSKRTDAFDSIKYIPLGSVAGQETYLTLGGQVRERYEYFNNLNFGSGVQDEDGYFLTRLMVHGDLHVGPNLRFFAQAKSALEDGREGGPRSSDRDEIEPQQVFADLRLPWTEACSTTVRFGRQELLYGAQRLIGPSDWTNTRRTFEGLRVINEFKTDNYTNTLDLLLVRPVCIRNNPLANEVEGFNEGDSSAAFWGAYDTVLLPKLIPGAKSKVEAYLLVLNQEATPSLSPARLYDADIYTVGARFSTCPKPFDFDLEGAYQFGTRGDADISAFFVSTEEGITIDQLAGSPRAFVGFDYASGDGNKTDGTYSTFTQLFSTGHKFFGEIDEIGRMNILSPSIGTDVTLLRNEPYCRKLGARVQYFAFWRANDNDSIYLAGGGAVARPASSTKDCIGQEVDFVLSWQVDRHLCVLASYNHFFAGEYINTSTGGNAGTAHDIDFAYLQATFTF